MLAEIVLIKRNRVLAPMILCASLCARLRMRFRPWWLEEAAPPVSFDATGGVVWEAGCALASHLLCASDAISRVRGCTVVELGSGTGLVSLAAYHAGASHVIATDLPEQCFLGSMRPCMCRLVLSMAVQVISQYHYALK